MAAFDTTRPQYAASDFAGRIGQAFAKAFGAFADWNDARVTRKALSQLTDRELNDIGLIRGEIDLISGQR